MVLLTRDGLKKLQDELKKLKARRPEVIARVDEARSLGDLSENEAYKAARREQAFLDGRIAELSELLKGAQTVTPPESGKIGLGSLVRVRVDGIEQEFTLVDESEADLAEGKLSHLSPIGRALLGKGKGEKVEISAPIGQVVYTILEVA